MLEQITCITNIYHKRSKPKHVYVCVKQMLMHGCTSRYVYIKFHLISALKNNGIYISRGDDFKQSFTKLGELNALFPDAAHLAMTATLTSSIRYPAT